MGTLTVLFLGGVFGYLPFAVASEKLPAPIEPNLVEAFCQLKSYDTRGRLEALYGVPTRVHGPTWVEQVEWKRGQVTVSATFNNGFLAMADIGLDLRRGPLFSLSQSPNWKYGKTTLSDVETAWGKGVRIGAALTTGRTTLPHEKENKEAARLLIDRCRHEYLFFDRKTGKPARLLFRDDGVLDVF